MPSKKQLEKEAKRAAEMRTADERAKEIKTLRIKLSMFGFPEDHEAMVEIEKAFADYLKHGETVCAKVSLKEWDRIAEIVLPARRTAECSIMLRYVGNKKAFTTERGGVQVTNIPKTSLETDAALARRANELASGLE